MDWDADPQRDAFQRALEAHSAEYQRKITDYLEFAKIVHRYDETAFVEHDDIPFVPLTLDELDGMEFPEDHVAIGRIALILIEPYDEYDVPDPDPWMMFDDYDEPKRCTRRDRKEDDDAGS